MTTSLRTRLFVGVTALAVAVGLVAGALAFRWSFEEAIEFQDAVLQQVGALAVRERLQTTPAAPAPRIEFEDQLILEELPRPGEAATSGPNLLRLPTDLADGLHVVPQSSGQWRVMVRTRDDGSRVAIAQPTATRDEIANDSALRSVLPLVILLPCLMLLVWVMIRVSFAPVAHLAQTLDVEPVDLIPDLSIDSLPREILPFVTAINRLLARTRAQFAQQKRFIADAAHELRTPITALSLQAQNLGHAALQPEDAERLAALQAGMRRIGRLLEQLLTLARSEAGPIGDERPLRRLDLEAREVVADCLPLAESRNIDLGFSRIDAALVRADTPALYALVRNLVDNALRHSPEGDRVDVAVVNEAAHVVLTVEDAGPGIPERDRARVFEPFFRGSGASGEGSGLGLSIVQRIVEAHQGSVELKAASVLAPVGLRVAVRLPCADATPPDASAPRGLTAAVSG